MLVPPLSPSFSMAFRYDTEVSLFGLHDWIYRAERAQKC